MATSSAIREASRLARRFTIANGRKFRLSDVDPDDTGGIDSKEHGAMLLAEGVARLQGLQEKLYAQGQWALLLIFQAMDAAGKDSIIKHVMSGVNPQGCQVFSFKAPSTEDLAHDFLWRTTRCLPERGRIGIFNRSYYEEVWWFACTPAAREAAPAGSRRIQRIWTERSTTSTASSAISSAAASPSASFSCTCRRRSRRALPRASREAGEELEV